MISIKEFLIPAIDIRGGKVVRLYKGDFSRQKVYYDNPADVAKQFADLGFKKIHIVDLDGAKEGLPSNLSVIEKIRNSVDCELQVGGGIRTSEAVEKLLNQIGINYVVIGTLAVKKPDLFEEIINQHPNKVILSIDSKEGKVAVGGWLQASLYSPEEFALQYEEKPIWGYLYTVIEKDGTLSGVDVEPYQRIKKVVKKPVLASGGVASLEDVKKLMGITDGVVVGRAIYEGKIDIFSL
ncbi:MAG: 1-(5-phosphoribosyl)-5-[(5-phosphoribosylamino)methylideneamino]imidazole-4-carboxamide isomerase [Aquificota bacterium]